MITTPSSTIPLSKQKKEQLQAVENRLSNLIFDIREAEQKLENTRRESVTAEKDREYQQGLLTALKAKMLEEEAKVLELQREFTSLTVANEKTRALVEQQRIEHDQKHRELVKREADVKAREVFSAERADSLEQYANKIATHKLEVEAAQKAFKKAMDSITWK